MSFVVVAALAIALLATGPVIAHLLRRGQTEEQEFPPTALVPSAPPVAQRRSRLQDRVLLAARAGLILALALLGAVPWVRCNRLSLSRDAGASVALAIVLDDSLSMQAETASGQTRWERVRRSARELVESTRDGDAVAVVLAGRPARLVLPATGDLALVRKTLALGRVTDRETDLAGAVQLARAAIKDLPQRDRRVVLLSDLAGEPVPAGEPGVWVPQVLSELRAEHRDCAVVSAERRDDRVAVQVACTSAGLAGTRQVRLLATEDSATAASLSTPHRKGSLVGSARLAPREGEQTVSVELSAPVPLLIAQLSEGDDIPADDEAPVVEEGGGLAVAVVSDPTTSSSATGGATLLEQAIDALASGTHVRPLTLLPDDGQILKRYAALFLDDPPGLGPEVRSAVETWIRQGGVAVGLLGPNAGLAQLGDTFEPFAHGAVRWEPTTVRGLDPATLGWLGPDADTLAELAPRGRALLAGLGLTGAEIVGTWDDGQPFALTRRLERGLVLTVSLPASALESDLPLTPGFLALVDHVLHEARLRRGPRTSKAGVSWLFPGATKVEVTGPAGPLPTRVFTREARAGGGADSEQVVVPEYKGRYRVRIGPEEELRAVTIAAEEVLRKPHEPSKGHEGIVSQTTASRADVSRQVAIVIWLLFVAEFVLRLTRRPRPGRPRVGPAAAPTSALR